MGQVCLSEPKLSSKGSQEMTTSQKRSMGRHLVSHLLRGQNGGSTPIQEKKKILIQKWIFSSNPQDLSQGKDISNLVINMKLKEGPSLNSYNISPHLERRFKYQSFKTHQMVENYLEKKLKNHRCEQSLIDKKNTTKTGIAETVTFSLNYQKSI